MSDLGLLTYYLGLEVKQDKDGISVCQSSYAKKILEDAGMDQCNASHTPLENRLKLRKNQGGAVDASEYRSLIGSLRYLVNTRPDFAYEVGLLSRFMEAPGKEHWIAIKQVLRYIKGTLNLGCIYRAEGETVLAGFSDSDHAGDLDDRKSTTGTVFFLGSGAITWSSQKQKVVAKSSCEAEYVAAAAATCQGVWLSRLVSEMLRKPPAKFKLFVDNQVAIAFSKNPVHHDQSKHIDIKYHYIRDCVETGQVEVDHIRTGEQLADTLTKALRRVTFVEMRQKLGMLKVGGGEQSLRG